MDHLTVTEISGVFGVVLFPVIFVAVLFRVLRKGARERYREYARIPFNED